MIYLLGALAPALLVPASPPVRARVVRMSETDAKAAALNEKLMKAETRKAEVRYPPCARAKPMPAPAPASRRRGLAAMKALFAGLVGGAVVRGVANACNPKLIASLANAAAKPFAAAIKGMANGFLQLQNKK